MGDIRMTSHLGLEVITVVLLATAAECADPADVSAAPPGRAGGAEAYYGWLTGCLDAVEKDLPKYTESAEAAAKLYVAGDCEIGAWGGDPFVREIYGRSGGIMQMKSLDKPFSGKGAAWAPPGKAIALVGLRDDLMGDAPDRIVEFKKRGYYVVVFGRAELIDKARMSLPNGSEVDDWIETHAAPHGGLLRDADGRWVVPTDSAALSTASWVWVAEFVAACTRLGKMPPMYLGYAVEGAKEREAKFQGLRFHDNLPGRLEAGKLSEQFLSELRKSLRQIHDLEMPGIRRAAADALEAKAAGAKLWVYLQGHVTLHLMGYPHDPRWFEPIHRDWNEMRTDVTVGPGDFILCIGFDQIFDGGDWQDFAAQARKVGAKLAWSFTDYRTEQVKAVPAGEAYIDQHWAKGDAVAVVPNYDIKCIPTSGVIAEAVLWMVHAEMLNHPPQ